MSNKNLDTKWVNIIKSFYLKWKWPIVSDHENLTDSHYLPGAGPLPVDIRFDFNKNGSTPASGSGGGGGGGGGGGSPPGGGSGGGGSPGAESYWTIACYPDQKDLVYDDPLLCTDGCKVVDKDESDCGPLYHKLFCKC